MDNNDSFPANTDTADFLSYMRHVGYTVYGLPPPQIMDDTWPGFLNSITYIIFTIIGFLGNSAIIALMLHMLFTGQAVSGIRWMTYPLILLSLTDLLVIASLPPLALQTAMDNWLLGQTFCRIHQFMESTTKTYTPLLLLVSSWQLNRCVASYSSTVVMCRGEVVHRGRDKRMIWLCGLVIFMATLTLCPVLYYSKLEKITKSPIAVEGQPLVMVFIYHFCLDSMSKTVYMTFTLIQLILCGIIPMVAFFVFLYNARPQLVNNSVNHRLSSYSDPSRTREPQSEFPLEPISNRSDCTGRPNRRNNLIVHGLNRVRIILCWIGVLWVVCHGPEWFANIISALDYTKALISKSIVMYYVIVVFTMLPSFCSSISWVMYNLCICAIRNPKHLLR